jgi:fido (protein-threonine AMPylation protein)
MTQFENLGRLLLARSDRRLQDQQARHPRPGVLEQIERSRSDERAIEIVANDVAIAPTYDLARLRAIHRQLFQDVYDWAGEL